MIPIYGIKSSVVNCGVQPMIKTREGRRNRCNNRLMKVQLSKTTPTLKPTKLNGFKFQAAECFFFYKLNYYFLCQ